MRKDSESEPEPRLKGLLRQTEKKSGSLTESQDDSQVRQEEEMIAHVMRSTPSTATGAPPVPYKPAAPARTGSTAEGDLRTSERPKRMGQIIPFSEYFSVCLTSLFKVGTSV